MPTWLLASGFARFFFNFLAFGFWLCSGFLALGFWPLASGFARFFLKLSALGFLLSCHIKANPYMCMLYSTYTCSPLLCKHGSGAVLVTLQLRPWQNTWRRPWQLPLQPLRRQRRHWPRYAVPKYKDWPLSPRNLSSLAGQKKTAVVGGLAFCHDPLLGVERPTVHLRDQSSAGKTRCAGDEHTDSRDPSKIQTAVHVSLWECPWKTSHNAEGPCGGLNQQWL